MEYLVLLQTQKTTMFGQGIGYHNENGIAALLKSIAGLMDAEIDMDKMIRYLDTAMIISYPNNRGNQVVDMLRNKIDNHFSDETQSNTYNYCLEAPFLGSVEKSDEAVEMIVNAHEGFLKNNSSRFKLVVVVADKSVLEAILEEYIETYLDVRIWTEKAPVNIKTLGSLNCIIGNKLDKNGKIVFTSF